MQSVLGGQAHFALIIVTVWSSSNHSHQTHFALLIVTVWFSSNHSHQSHFALLIVTVWDHTVTIINAKCAWWLWLWCLKAYRLSELKYFFILKVANTWCLLLIAVEIFHNINCNENFLKKMSEMCTCQAVFWFWNKWTYWLFKTIISLVRWAWWMATIHYVAN
jgi:hypothetical protein